MTTYSKPVIHGKDAATIKRLGIGEGHKASKYHNVPTVVDGLAFDSKAEAARYGELKMLEQAGQIANLQAHPTFIIVDKDAHGGFMRYEADFMYRDWSADGVLVVEDVKGGRATQTPLWRLKWRLVQARYPEHTFKVVTR